MDFRIPMPVRRILAGIAIFIGGIWWLLSFIGNIDTARELVGGRSEAVLNLLNLLAPSQWLGLVLFIGGVVALCLMRSQPVPTKKRKRAPKRATRAPASTVAPDNPIILDTTLPPLTPTTRWSLEVDSEKTKRSEIRDKLSSYLIVADKLKRQMERASDHVPKEEVDKWYEEASTFIRQRISYADRNRFISDTNIPTIPKIDHSFRASGNSAREQLWQFLNKRAYQLAKILDEYKPL